MPRKTIESERLQSEVECLRHFILRNTGEPFSDLLEAYTYEYSEQHPLKRELLKLILDAGDALAEETVSLDNERRVQCPLCHETPSMNPDGFTFPIGLERHLIGWGSREACMVMDVVERTTQERASLRQRSQIAPVQPVEAPPLVRPHVAQRFDQNRVSTLWEIDSKREMLSSPLARSLRIPRVVKWFWGTREEAEYLGKRWIQALRWRRVTIDTQLWIRWGRDHWIHTLDDPDEPARPLKPRWAGRHWDNDRPVLVEERPAWRSEEMMRKAARDAQEAWERMNAREELDPAPVISI